MMYAASRLIIRRSGTLFTRNFGDGALVVIKEEARRRRCHHQRRWRSSLFSTRSGGNNHLQQLKVPARGGTFQITLSKDSPAITTTATRTTIDGGDNDDNTGVGFDDQQHLPHPVLCLPGALGTGLSDFEHQLLDRSCWNPEFQSLALDPCGLGGSCSYDQDGKRRDREYPLDFYVQDASDAASVMEELGYDKCSVLGWSDDANVAIHLAANCPSNVVSMVLWGGNSYVTKEDIDAYEAVRDVQMTWSQRAKDDKIAVHGGSLDQLQKLNDACTDAWININNKNDGDVCMKQLHHVHCPTLIVHGKHDVICDMKHAEYMSKRITNSKLILMDNGKHNLHQKHAKVFNEMVREFLLQNITTTTTNSE